MFNTIEFKAKIKNGIIEIPQKYQQDFSEDNEVKIIVVKSTKSAKSQAQKGKDIIDYLTENPAKINEFISGDEIYDR